MSNFKVMLNKKAWHVLLQLSPDEALEIKGALQAIQLCEKGEQLKEREMKILSLEKPSRAEKSN